MAKETKNYIDQKLTEAYEIDFEGSADFATEIAKGLASKYLDIAVNEGIDQARVDGEFPDEAAENAVKQALKTLVIYLNKQIETYE